MLGIDLAKQRFQLHGVDADGNVVLKLKLTRNELVEHIAQLPPCLIVMEDCGGSHHWVRVFTKLGHTVRLIAPQLV